MAFITFENGLRAVCSEKIGSNVCSVVVHINGGCQSEKNNQSGLTEYVSRLLLRGTKNYPSKEALLNYAKLHGIILKTHASRESLTISAVCSNETLNWAVELLAEIVFDYQFNETTALKTKNQLLVDLERLSENYAYTLEKSVNQTLFSRTGLANPKFGTAITVERFDENAANEYMQKMVTPKNTIVSATGNIDPEEFYEYVNTYFVPRLPADTEYKKIKFVAEVEGFEGSLRTRNKRLNQSRICIAFPTYSYKNSKKYLPQIIKPILHKKLSDTLRLTTNFFSTFEIASHHYANNGKFCIEISVDYEHVEDYLKNFIRALKAVLTEDTISEEEFELEKNLFLTNLLYKYDNCLEESLISAKEIAILKNQFNKNSEKLKIEMLNVKDANNYMIQTLDLDKMFVSYLGHPIELTFEDLLNA